MLLLLVTVHVHTSGLHQYMDTPPLLVVLKSSARVVVDAIVLVNLDIVRFQEQVVGEV